MFICVSLYVFLYNSLLRFFSEQDKWSSQKRVKGCPLFTRDVFTMRIYRHRHTPRQRLANLALRSVSSKHFRFKVNLISYSVRASNIVTGFLMEMKYSFAYRKLSFERMGAAYEEFKSINIYIHIFIWAYIIVTRHNALLMLFFIVKLAFAPQRKFMGGI